MFKTKLFSDRESNKVFSCFGKLSGIYLCN